MKANIDLAFGQDIIVLWEDSAVNPGWNSVHVLGETGSIHTCATVVHATKAHLTVSAAVDVDTHAALAPLTIPWGCITKIQVLGG